MKGIVMEIKEKELVVLKKNGEFIRTAKTEPNIRIGQEISIVDAKGGRKTAFRRFAALAASLMIFVGAGAGTYAYYAPEGFVDVDINPGIEMTYNRFDKVIKAEGINEEGKRVLETAGKIKNKGVGTAMKMILEAAEENEFLVEDSENYINVLVSGKNRSENLEKAEKAIRNHHEEKGLRFSYNAEEGSMERYREFKAEAEELEITPGKLNLLKKVYGNPELYEERDGESVLYEEYKDYSVKEIMQTFNRGKGKGSEKDVGNDKDDREEESGDDNEEDGNEMNGNGNSGKGNSGKGNR